MGFLHSGLLWWISGFVLVLLRCRLVLSLSFCFGVFVTFLDFVLEFAWVILVCLKCVADAYGLLFDAWFRVPRDCCFVLCSPVCFVFIACFAGLC